MEHMEKKGILIVISGFSGAGKGTLVRELLSRHGQDYVLSVSMTTRAPRPGERDGVEYFFSDRAHFEEIIGRDGLVEYASYCGNYYGTARAYVEEKLAEGKNVILEIEIQGALKIKKKFPESLVHISVIKVVNHLLLQFPGFFLNLLLFRSPCLHPHARQNKQKQYAGRRHACPSPIPALPSPAHDKNPSIVSKSARRIGMLSTSTASFPNISICPAIA